MNFILIHIAIPQKYTFPSHFKYCVQQIRATNPNSIIYILTNLPINTNESHIKIININDLQIPDIGDYYKYDPMGELFRNALLRIFYLEAFMKKYNIIDVIHFDNDVLIYENMDNISDCLKQFDFLMTSHFKTEYVFGFSYLKNVLPLTQLNNKLLKLVVLGEHRLQQIITDCMPHEMRLLAYINEHSNPKIINNLPILPFGEGSDNFSIFKMCFDPSSYGKHLTGSHELTPTHLNYAPTKKYFGTEKHHLIGQALINNKINVDFENKHPILEVQNNKYKICNLHIHTKELEKYVI